MPWNNDLIQFARLICEINATQPQPFGNLDCAALCSEMDLEQDEVNELFERAHEVWEDFKENGFHDE
tara:strand:+ start:120 stop:320 length:201 start_codon:yes stop_codon:yes gene_type:complete